MRSNNNHNMMRQKLDLRWDRHLEGDYTAFPHFVSFQLISISVRSSLNVSHQVCVALSLFLLPHLGTLFALIDLQVNVLSARLDGL